MSDDADEENPTRASGGFFAIDRGAFRCAAVGGLNAAVAHLVMARGTDRDNRKTQWSVHSIEQRTGISRPNAAKAVKDLLDRGIWKKMRDGQHPIYEAVCGNQIPGGPFTADEQAAIAAVGEGNPIPYESKTALEPLKARGIIRECNGRSRGRTFELDTAAIAALTEPLMVWLPNALIDGAADEVPPVELIRQTRSLPAFRLLVELYAAQFLPNFGGVPRELLKMVFERVKVGEQGPFVVWGFQSKHILAGRDLFRPFLTGQFTKRDDGTQRDDGMDASFWPGIQTLTDLGLVEPVGMLLDGDDNEAEIIHPYAMRGSEPAERELALAAHYAALPMVTDGQREWAEQHGYKWLIPVSRHIANATLIEVYRLKYRPHTAATAAWYAVMQRTTGQYLDHYRAISKDREISGGARPDAISRIDQG
jgi:hypothetical protein